MPRYKSINGVWHPVGKRTKLEMEMKGLETLGKPASDADESAVTPAMIAEEPTKTEEEKEVAKDRKKRVRFRLGVKSKKTRRKES